MRRRTLVREVVRSSLGVHCGLPCTLKLRPAPFGHGVCFEVDGVEVPATLAHAEAEPGSTVLRRASARVGTPEHLLAALDALGVTDVRLLLEGPEVPILDGSALPWVEAIDEAGRVEGPPAMRRGLEREVRVALDGGTAVLGPGSFVAVEVDYGEGGPAGTLRVERTETAFREAVAWARTFVLAVDVDRLRAEGRGRGATAENTVVWPGSTLRAPDEPVRHKLLDAWGDLALLGPSSAALTVTRGSHRLHQRVLRSVG